MSKTRIDLLKELKQNNHYPDILDCMAQLSPNEVPTPPRIVKEMLNLLPQNIFSDPNIKFLDPCTKSAVFLREIAVRLNMGLKSKIPNEQERIKHILTKQLYGLAITELTALISRRTLYCSKEANSKYSICKFKDKNGNIEFNRIEHKWKNGNCELCGASQAQWDRGAELETHAYSFIHTNEKENYKLFERLKNMKFDVIIGNPPYQISDGGNSASAKPLYHLFVEQAKKLNPRYITMIIPSRWFSGGKGLDDFRNNMLTDHHIKHIVDFPNAEDCFPGVEIAGGVNYFLWDSTYDNLCKITTIMNGKIQSTSQRFLDEYDTFIRWSQGVSIVKKVISKKEISLDTIASSRKPFGLATNFADFDYEPSNKKYKIFSSNQVGVRKVGFTLKENITKGIELINKWKVLMPKAYRLGSSTDGGYIHPIIADPGSVCTETFIVLFSCDNERDALNFVKYIKTRFFRFLVYLKKVTQDATAKVYSFVPVQDFTQEWTDKKLYKKYNLSQEEIDFIESMIKPME